VFLLDFYQVWTVKLYDLVPIASNTFCVGRTDGFYDIPEGSGCEQVYLSCSGGHAKIMQCADMTVFHSARNRCDWKSAVAPCAKFNYRPPTAPIPADAQQSGALFKLLVLAYYTV